MKTFLLLLIMGCTFQICCSQPATVKGLIEYLNLREVRLESQLSKDGYKKNFLLSESGNTAFAYEKNNRADSQQVFRSYKMLKEDELNTTLLYETSSLSERNELLNELVADGFHAPSATMYGNKMVYQKDNISIEPGITSQNHEYRYWFRISKRALPKASSITYAEDLLNFNSHEFLVAVFGEENVKKDIFHYTAQETNKCTVIFPNTSKEAIFVWKDEDNYKDVAFILIGGGLEKKETKNYVYQVPRNAWLSKQGIYCGMSLQDVAQLNKQDIKLYNWNTDAGGYLAPHNRGAIDFSKIGLVFNCWNCSLESQESQKVISSNYFSGEYKKVYVNTLIILPEKKHASGAITQGNTPGY